MSTRDNPRGLPADQLVSVVRRNPESANDWGTVYVDPALVRPVKVTRIPRPGLTQREVERLQETL